MLRLLNIELQKLLLNKTSKVLIIISFILPFFVILLSSFKINFFGLFTIELGEYGIFNFPLIWHITTFFAAFFKIFFAIVVVSMIGNEYSYKTLKQNLIDGLSKKEFILSKFYTIAFFSLVSTVLIFLITICIGFYYSSIDEFSIVIRGTEFILAYFVKLLGFFSFCLFLGMLLRKSAFALAFLFIEYLLEWFIFWGAYQAFDNSTEKADMVKGFLPLESMYNLINQPIQRAIMMYSPDKVDFSYDYAVHWYEILIVLAWTAIFIFSSYKLLEKRDL